MRDIATNARRSTPRSGRTGSSSSSGRPEVARLSGSPPLDDAGNGGFAHVHITLWQTDDGGNWDRHAAPFTGQFAISGMDFPDDGSSNEYSGTVIYP